MAGREPFYYEIVKKLIVTFASIFEEVDIYDTHNRKIRVPLHYATKEKFLEAFNIDHDGKKFDIVFPRMGFEITSLNYSPERHLNPMSKIDNLHSNEHSNDFMYNRIPYDFQVELYVGAKRQEDGLKIIEQVVPFFTPELTITIKDLTEFDIYTNIPIVLNSISMQIENEGSFEQRREIMWVLSFTIKAFLYSDIRKRERIKETIMNLTISDSEHKFIKLISEVVPREANKDEPHEIIDTLYDTTIE